MNIPPKDDTADIKAAKTLPEDENQVLQKIHENKLKLDAREERNAELEELREQIEGAREYIHIGFWNKALEILKKIIDDPRLPHKEQDDVRTLYIQARERMDEAALTNPEEVQKFAHFNLPTKDVN